MIEANAEGYEKIREVADNLQGTCRNIDDVLQEVFEDDGLTLTDIPVELLLELDGITMRCTTCDWWFEPHELDETETCKDCGGNPDDD